MNADKKEIPKSIKSGVSSRPGKKERILIVFIRICRAILRFFERRMISSRAKRLAKRMEGRR